MSRIHLFVLILWLGAFCVGVGYAQDGAQQIGESSRIGSGNRELVYDGSKSPATVGNESVINWENAETIESAISQEAAQMSFFNPASQLKFAGGVDFLMVGSTARVLPSGMPLFLPADSPFGLSTNNFDLHARQSFLNANLVGPDVGDFQIGGNILVFLQNDNLVADDYGLLVYYAYGEVKNEDWRFAGGLQADVFNPMSPTVVYLTKLYGSGNSGSYRAQARLERFFQRGENFGVTVQAALSDPLDSLIPDSATRVSEDNGWPNAEARVEFGLGLKGGKGGPNVRPLQVGFSGVVGQTRTTNTIIGGLPPAGLTPRNIIDTWGVGTDFQLWANDSAGVRGEFFYGQALGEYNGGIVQSFNPITFEEVDAVGGFLECFWYYTDQLHVHVGYGIDNPDNHDLAPFQISQNQTYFMNWIWDASSSLQLSLQVDYRRTDYTEFQPGILLDSDAVVVATRCLWKF